MVRDTLLANLIGWSVGLSVFVFLQWLSKVNVSLWFLSLIVVLTIEVILLKKMSI